MEPKEVWQLPPTARKAEPNTDPESWGEPQNVDTVTATDAAAEDNATQSDEWVRYVGTADERVISKADWRQAGVVSSKTAEVRWDRSNGKVVNRSDLSFLSAEEFDRIIGEDEHLKVQRSD